jgi:acyl carrier protein
MSPNQPLGTKMGFMELGLDSLMAVQFRNELKAAYGLPLPYTLTYDHPSVDALAKFLAGAVSVESPLPNS